MVIFHSYIKLPEGRSINYFYGPCSSLQTVSHYQRVMMMKWPMVSIAMLPKGHEKTMLGLGPLSKTPRCTAWHEPSQGPGCVAAGLKRTSWENSSPWRTNNTNPSSCATPVRQPVTCELPKFCCFKSVAQHWRTLQVGSTFVFAKC